MDQQMIRRATPFVYVIAILIAVFAGSGTWVAAVAAIGGVATGLVYAVTSGSPRR